MPSNAQQVLTLNSGSSSLKLAVYQLGQTEALFFAANVSRIGHSTSRISVSGAAARNVPDVEAALGTPNEALAAALQLLEKHAPQSRIDAVSHRLVHGGPRHKQPQRITPQLLGELRELVPIDPDHMPQAIDGIEASLGKFPSAPQFACFDTSFHRAMPRVAQLCPLPMRYFDKGVLRYGFHGISYEYILSELLALAGERAAGRVVVAHLGNGASMAAIHSGSSLDTSMGFTPTSGLLMGTRCGDLDPGVIPYLLAHHNTSLEDLGALLNKRSGLLGMSGVSEDMRELLDQEAANPDAAAAVALFCYRAKKYVASYAAVLGGLDILVFTAGIGENSPAVRERICGGMEWLGIRIDPARNRLNAPVISTDDSRVDIRVIKTNENLMLARHAAALLKDGQECG